jgi:saccharopine dehydrogenase-like NADP-dependent oxidoreductase
MLRAMRIAVLGAGIMGSATARLLRRWDDVELLVLDPDGERAAAVAARVSADARKVGVGDPDLPRALEGAAAMAACIPYRLNLEAMEAALEARVPYADLGGLFHVTRRQLERDGDFRQAGVPAVLGIGCCPGISNVLARATSERLDEVRSIDIVDGAVEEDGGFGVPYSMDTILDEFSRPAMVFEDGRLREVPPASGAIRYRFPEPLGEMEAVYTLHSEPATLPHTIEGVRDVRWRLALPPKIAEGFRLLVDLGLASEDPLETPSGKVIPRELLRALLGRGSTDETAPRDVEVLEVTAAGSRNGGPATVVGTARFDPSPEGIGAGAFGTSIPLVIATRWLAERRIPPGVHPPETALEPDPFLDEVRGQGAAVEIRDRPAG